MRVVFRVVDADAGVWGCPVSAELFPVLPVDWDDEGSRYYAVHAGTGCWIWTDPRVRGLSWRSARTLIATQRGIVDVSDCAITPQCVHPFHSRHTRLPVGGSA